jgi:hypothetical protein
MPPTDKSIHMLTTSSPWPAAVRWLGYGSLIPFVGMALVGWLEPNHRFW